MRNSMQLILYGNASAQEKARSLIEDLSEVKDCLQEPGELKLVLNKYIPEISLIPLLCQSGIQGFKLIQMN